MYEVREFGFCATVAAGKLSLTLLTQRVHVFCILKFIAIQKLCIQAKCRSVNAL